MQALTLPARRGWRWLTEGFQIFRKKQLLLSFLVLGYWVLMLVVNSLPWVGQVVATVLVPVFSVSLMNACRLVAQGSPLPPLLLFSGFDKNLRGMLTLGLIYFVSSLCVLGMTVLIDDGVLFKIFVYGLGPEDKVVVGGKILMAIEFALAAYIPVVMAYWYAPVLVAWHDLSPVKALFFSFIACLRNWRVFLVYILVLLVFGAFLPSLLLGILSTAFAGAGEQFSITLTVFTALILLPTVYASFYVSYRDVFVIIDEDA